MKTRNLLQGIAVAAAAASLSSCASLQSATDVSDYNGDGVVSNAEYAQFQKRKNVEDRNVYSESVKRKNATNTVRDVRDGLWDARSATRILKNW